MQHRSLKQARSAISCTDFMILRKYTIQKRINQVFMLSATQQEAGEGTNSYGTIGYGGPCPPADGQLHHYVFRLYALSISHISGTALNFNDLLNAMEHHVVGTTSIIGTFKLPG